MRDDVGGGEPTGRAVDNIESVELDLLGCFGRITRDWDGSNVSNSRSKGMQSEAGA